MSRRPFNASYLWVITFLAGLLGPATMAFAAVSDHYKCYASKQLAPVFQRENVTLADAFESTVETVLRPRFFCNPVNKEEGGHPGSHRPPELLPHEASPGDSGLHPSHRRDRQPVRAPSLYLGRRADLCVPAEKDGVASTLDVNHHKCYRAQIPEGEPRFLNRFVSLADQFETKQTVVKRPRLFCNPVDKNGEGILDPALTLTCTRSGRSADRRASRVESSRSRTSSRTANRSRSARTRSRCSASRRPWYLPPRRRRPPPLPRRRPPRRPTAPRCERFSTVPGVSSSRSGAPNRIGIRSAAERNGEGVGLSTLELSYVSGG